LRKIIEISKPGGYEQLKVVEKPDLVPTENQVLVQAQYCGVNYADCCVRWGVYESAKKYVGWPITPGFEVSGVVAKLGRGVTGFKEGDEVIAFTRFDGYASQVCVDQSQIMKKPASMSMPEAAGFPAVFMTAYYAFHQLFIVRPGSRILVHSAAGGVGTAMIQVAKQAGCEVIGIVGSSHKVPYLQAYGINEVIDKSTNTDFHNYLKNKYPGGFDVVYDANGYTTFESSYQLLKPTGRLVIYGSHSLLPKSGGRINYIKAGWGLLKTKKIAPLTLITDNKSVIGFNVSFLFEEKEMMRENIAGLSRLLAQGAIKAAPAKVFDFEKAGEAHQAIESGQSVGKLVLKI
jgi:NADPH:quinone reductase-like Zn-dependent oxidoreductase